ncbi:Lysine exporter protein (LYSE/YGGA) [Rhodomicrobium vannielii ATCC 17100]|uniref:Lysine exporter protein (LYSE/YGGA) n=1 Tax=Rhodomicrobium vannielii (strain ATCC 17100 / DSM 162 / LMG 4299 / NCIMB 10020 / ATH 3.1.1) TaxID=648757 RepID=E3I4E6_RHOVT|nr:LysE family transporter [Rhodomicrobium vannielii]ADP70461.1 Lysine exporter protein (LYSE/YGGA) [Rhodomicrobium vannielii ATCC 17100]
MWAESIIDPTRFAIIGLVIGVLIAAPVGPVNIVCIQRTLERGFWGGFAAGLGAVLADGLIASVAAYGATAISGFMRAHQLKIELVGGIILVAFGFSIYRSQPKIVATATTNIARLRRLSNTIPPFFRPALRFRIWRIVPHLNIVPQTFFLTITNPGAILGLFALFGGATSIMGGIDTWIQAVTAVTSIMTGSLLWWMGLSRLISRVRHKLTESRLKRINQASGVVLVIFGLALFAQFAYGLAGHRFGESEAGAAPPVTAFSILR